MAGWDRFLEEFFRRRNRDGPDLGVLDRLSRTWASLRYAHWRPECRACEVPRTGCTPPPC